MTEVAQAATWVMTGPVRPYSIDSMQARHRAGQGRDGERADEARTLLVVDVRAVDDLLDAAAAGVDDDADPVALRPGPSPRSRSRNRATASAPAPIASWMKRLIRRAILASITVVGSKSRTSAAIRTSKADRVEALDDPGARSRRRRGSTSRSGSRCRSA